MAFLAVLSSPSSPIPKDPATPTTWMKDAKAVINPRGEHVITTDGTTFHSTRTNQDSTLSTVRR